MSGLLPLIFALVIAETSAEALPLFHPALAWNRWWWPLVLGLSFVFWLGLSEGSARLVARGKSWRAMQVTDLALQAGILGWYALLCYGWGWSHQYRNFCVSLAPWLGAQLVLWWCMAVAVRSITGHPWSRFARVMYQLRFGVLPVLIILPFFDLGAWLARTLDIERWYTPDTPGGILLTALSIQGFLLVVLTLLPIPLMWLWGAKPLPAGPLAQQMQAICQRLGVRVAGLLRWPVPGGKVYNAAVVGMVPRLRYVLFTDDLVRDLPPEELTAVLGHELGHARHGHLWLYFLFATLAVLTVTQIQGPVAEIIRPWLSEPPPGVTPFSPQDPLGGMVKGLAALLLLALQWRLLFGYISRACERQADLAGAEVAGDALVMGQALKSVARLAGQPENAPSWRHYTIAARVAFLQRVHADPDLGAHHHRQVASMRNLLVALCFAVAAAWAVNFWFNPDVVTMRDPSQVRQALGAWADADPDLGAALAKADQGDVRTLSAWVNRTNDLERQRLARWLLALTVEDTRAAYRHRHRLRAFLCLSTGEQDWDQDIENTFAYVAVAGTDQPTAIDLTIAHGQLLPRLEERARRSEHHALWDTVGCIRFAKGEYTLAAENFTRAVESLAKSKNAAQLPAEQRLLYRRRQEAARTNAADGPPVPLPKDWPEPVSQRPAMTTLVPAPATGTTPAPVVAPGTTP